MRGRSAVAIAVLTGATLIAAGCGGGTDHARPGAPASRTESGNPTAAPGAFAFSAPALGGGRVVGADYADTGVALWFWAPW